MQAAVEEVKVVAEGIADDAALDDVAEQLWADICKRRGYNLHWIPNAR